MRRKRQPLWLALLLLVLWWAAPWWHGADIKGSARAVDGDTLVVEGQTVRLQGVDAPEKKQACTDARGTQIPCGQEVWQRLAQKLDGKRVACSVDERDRYGRAVGFCSVDGRLINAWLVRKGWAMAYAEYDVRLMPLEWLARLEQQGLWQGSFDAPWVWRKIRRADDRS
jgi:endonuclease YncB( thermonuclease family)